MILLSVGTQLPFDRLVHAVDDWAFNQGRTDVVAQVGPSNYSPRILAAFPYLSPDAFRELQSTSSVIVSHAGMGSILTALEFGKPIIIMPRDHARGEHRNGHQIATATRFKDTPGVYVAMNEIELTAHLNQLDKLSGSGGMSAHAPAEFLAKLEAFINEL